MFDTTIAIMFLRRPADQRHEGHSEPVKVEEKRRSAVRARRAQQSLRVDVFPDPATPRAYSAERSAGRCSVLPGTQVPDGPLPRSTPSTLRTGLLRVAEPGPPTLPSDLDCRLTNKSFNDLLICEMIELPGERPTFSDFLKRGLLDLIRRDRLGEGDRLPTVQALAARFSVAPPTMREVLRQLQAVGVVEIRHGSGIYVKRATLPIVLANPHPGRLMRRTILDLLEARRVIEPELAGLAARRGSDAEIAAAQTVLDEAGAHLLGQREEEDRLLGRLNLDFHREMARMSGSSVLAEVIESLLDVYLDEQRLVMRVYNNRAGDHAQHLEIFDAIATHDARAAEHRMRAHLRDMHDVLETRLPPDADLPAAP